jgi:hypothetical protein
MVSYHRSDEGGDEWQHMGHKGRQIELVRFDQSVWLRTCRGRATEEAEF